jgi:alkanesulfonate monooxygenase SsuD/methylene tetrahydromethanopterin reductase-like flavin-dependent oxidoreductase (luciferase family)
MADVAEQQQRGGGGIGGEARPEMLESDGAERAHPPIERGVALREPLAWHDFVQVARTVEQTHYEALFVPEIAGREAFSTLAALAPLTETLRLGSGVIPITSRVPMTTAMGAATVQELSGGRFVLGLGAGFERSLDAMRRYVADVRAAQLSFDAGPPPSIWLAALGDGMLRLAGEIAEGILLNWCTPQRVAEARGIVEAAAREADRDPPTVAVYVRACIEPDEDVALAALGPQAAQYASIPHYRRQLDHMGLGAAADAAARGDRPDELVRSLCVLGDAAAAATRLAEYASAGADLTIVYPVPVLDPVSSLLGTILSLAPEPALEA